MDGLTCLHIRRAFYFRGGSLKNLCTFNVAVFVGKVNKNAVHLCLAPTTVFYCSLEGTDLAREKLRTLWLFSEPKMHYK